MRQSQRILRTGLSGGRRTAEAKEEEAVMG